MGGGGGRRAQRIELMEGKAQAEEEERRATYRAPVQPPENAAIAAWETAFLWPGPAPMLVDLTGPDDDEEEDAYGNTPPRF
ncbi:hypothetical protein D1007_57945 [Hordeum vulgare]|nr:hypothetical protein D1007_57945 [Hordeum vulgare]